MNLLTVNIRINTHIEISQPKCYNIIKEAYIFLTSNKEALASGKDIENPMLVDKDGKKKEAEND